AAVTHHCRPPPPSHTGTNQSTDATLLLVRSVNHNHPTAPIRLLTSTRITLRHQRVHRRNSFTCTKCKPKPSNRAQTAADQHQNNTEAPPSAQTQLIYMYEV